MSSGPVLIGQGPGSNCVQPSQRTPMPRSRGASISPGAPLKSASVPFEAPDDHQSYSVRREATSRGRVCGSCTSPHSQSPQPSALYPPAASSAPCATAWVLAAMAIRERSSLPSGTVWTPAAAHHSLRCVSVRAFSSRSFRAGRGRHHEGGASPGRAPPNAASVALE